MLQEREREREIACLSLSLCSRRDAVNQREKQLPPVDVCLFSHWHAHLSLSGGDYVCSLVLEFVLESHKSIGSDTSSQWNQSTLDRGHASWLSTDSLHRHLLDRRFDLWQSSRPTLSLSPTSTTTTRRADHQCLTVRENCPSLIT